MTPTPGPHTIKRQSVPDSVAASLRDRILRGEFKDGEQLRQEAIATEYDVSRMPVREALRQLEAEGLVRFQTHKGAIVTRLSPKEVGELFELRVLLEAELLAQALPRMEAADLDGSEAVLRQLEAAYARGDTAEWGALNWAYHRSLYAPADRPQTMSLALTINNQTDRYVRLQLVMTGAFARAEREHRELLRLCRAGDRKAVPFLRRHILDTKAELLRAMQSETRQAA
ncbi:MAG: GntR family transcriptional regulator [Janthinobacterium lividum]